MTAPPSIKINSKFSEFYLRKLRRLRQQAFDYDLTLEITDYKTSGAAANLDQINQTKEIIFLIDELQLKNIYYLDYLKNKTLLKVG